MDPQLPSVTVALELADPRVAARHLTPIAIARNVAWIVPPLALHVTAVKLPLVGATPVHPEAAKVAHYSQISDA